MTKSSLRIEGVTNSLWNEDTAPMDQENRTWNAAYSGLLWAAMAVSLPSYLLASGMIALGISVGTVLGSALAGGIVVAVLAMGCGHAGVRYGIPFAVLARIAFGVVGARVPVALRLIVGCAWVGVGCWLGGEALCAMLVRLSPLVPETAVWVCFGAFLLIVASPMGWNWKLVTGGLLGACCLLVFAVLVWIELRSQGVAKVAADVSVLPPGSGSPGRGIAFNATGVLGLWLPVALGACDLSKRACSQRALMSGACAVPVAMVLFCGVTATIAALALKQGLLYWNPVVLGNGIARGIFAVVCPSLLAAVVLITARPLTGWLGDQIAGLTASQVSAPTGRWLVCLVAALSMPWRWIASPERYIGEWLTGCAGLLAPMAAILLVEYFALRRRWLNVDDLYQRDGLYEYAGGWNWKAFGALAAGWLAMAFIAAAPSFASWRSGAVWIGTAVCAAAYWVLRSGPPDVAKIPPTPLLIPLVGFESEGASG